METESRSARVQLMDFDQLVTFFEVAKLGNFSRAGQKVFRSQSAVSAQIRQLEQEYGERLLDLYRGLGGLDSLTGQTTSDDILGLIFSKFCIGK